jgi:hypothetical protein
VVEVAPSQSPLGAELAAVALVVTVGEDVAFVVLTLYHPAGHRPAGVASKFCENEVTVADGNVAIADKLVVSAELKHPFSSTKISAQ